MENLARFYDWVSKVVSDYSIPHDARICDIGCGTGALLERLRLMGFESLSGIDFATACVSATRARVPGAEISRHDIELAPLLSRYDVITLTTVLDFLSNPAQALENIRQSLAPTGIVFVTIRNRLAYWPWYHLRGLSAHIPSTWLRRWYLWLTTPLGLRRIDQPFEQVFSVNEGRQLLLKAGLSPVAEYGHQVLPMLWLEEIPAMLRFARLLEDFSHKLTGKTRYYYYLFVCSPGSGMPAEREPVSTIVGSGPPLESLEL
jgi:SAM-dependent methyltransferase